MSYFYGVKEGLVPGVYKTWGECQSQVNGYKGAVFKKFTSYADAEEFVYGKVANNTEFKKIENNTEDVLYAYVDGSYSEEKNISGYGVVLVKNNKVIFKDLGAFRDSDLNESRNVFGEIRGALKAVEMALANDFKEIVIVYDYMGIECWATGEWKANKPLTKDYRDFMQKYMGIINIQFKKVKAHSGEDKYNDMADLLAKRAVNA